jgi:hypothetical protein
MDSVDWVILTAASLFAIFLVWWLADWSSVSSL